VIGPCRYCDRTCGRCGYPIKGGWEHVARPLFAGSNVVVCTIRSGVRGPLAEVMGEWARHAEHRKPTERKP
jgi:hypothetical protein